MIMGKLSTKSTIKVVAEVVSHDKEDKVAVFKMKRRKGHQKENGRASNSLRQFKLKI